MFPPMSSVRESITTEMAEWIGKQRMFFVGTAPLAAEGHVNLSPKGGEAFRILGPLEVAYQDYTGSGAETAAHIRENGRIVIMFCAFEGPPKIVRLHGRGTLITPGHERFAELLQQFPANPGNRAFIHITVTRVSDSCGFSVPYYQYVSDRDVLDKWAAAQGPAKVAEYRVRKNQRSIDGLPAFGAKGH
jgi:hypothetical protein